MHMTKPRRQKGTSTDRGAAEYNDRSFDSGVLVSVGGKEVGSYGSWSNMSGRTARTCCSRQR